MMGKPHKALQLKESYLSIFAIKDIRYKRLEALILKGSYLSIFAINLSGVQASIGKLRWRWAQFLGGS